MFVAAEMLLSICSATKKKSLEERWFTQIHFIDSNITLWFHFFVSAWLIFFLAKSWTAVVTNGFFIYSPFRENPDSEINMITYLEVDFFLKAKCFVEEICILSTAIKTAFAMN